MYATSTSTSAINSTSMYQAQMWYATYASTSTSNSTTFCEV